MDKFIIILETATFVTLCLWVAYLEYTIYSMKKARYKKASRIISIEEKMKEILDSTYEIHEYIRKTAGISKKSEIVGYESVDREFTDTEEAAIQAEMKLQDKTKQELIMEELSKTSINGLKLEGLKPGILDKVREYSMRKDAEE